MNKVTVLGSLNVDSILRFKRFPKPGETLPLTGKSVAGGGKGLTKPSQPRALVPKRLLSVKLVLIRKGPLWCSS